MSSETVLTATVRESGESNFAVEIDMGGHLLIGDEPVEAGGLGLGPSPYMILLAALGECTVMTVRWYARKMGWPVTKIEARLTYHKEGRDDVFTKHIAIHGDNVTDEQRKKLIEVAEKCPVQKTLEGAPRITTAVM